MSLPLQIQSSEIGEFASLDHSSKMEDERCVKTIMNAFANAFMDEVNVGVILLDSNGFVVEISAVALEMFKLNHSSSIGMHVNFVLKGMPEERRKWFADVLQGKELKNQMFSWDTESRQYELLVDANRLYNRFGVPVGAYIFFKDVTLLRSLEEQVRHSDRLKTIGQIAAGAAHEIRNPLTSIKGFLQLMKQSCQSKKLVKESQYTDVMLAEIERINRLVGEFLMLSKPGETAPDRICSSAVLKEMLPVIESEALLYDIVVHYHLSGTTAEVLVDREQLKQVILNLCKNAIESMALTAGTLTIRERINYHEQTVAIEIHDQGSGIPPFLIDKIFDPFFTTKESGTGLGLPICKRILNDMGGQIRISSKGFGTIVTVTLPLHI